MKTEEEDVRRYATAYLTEPDVSDTLTFACFLLQTVDREVTEEDRAATEEDRVVTVEDRVAVSLVLPQCLEEQVADSSLPSLDRFANLDGGQQSYADSGYGQQAAGGYGGQQQQGGCAFLSPPSLLSFVG